MEQSKITKEQFGEMVKKSSPNSHLFTDCVKAFFVGGAICLLSQLYLNWIISLGVEKETAGLYNSVTLIFIAALTTGLGLYEKLGKFAGAGSVVPITGFSNSVAAPAMEFKREGFIFGVGAKMFIVAGPVIVYGAAASAILGVICFIIKILNQGG